MKRSEESLRGLWDTVKQNNVYIIGVQGEEKKNGSENLCKDIMAKNLTIQGRN